MKNSIGEKFSNLRLRSGFTQSQVAKYLGVDQSYISKCEKDERQFSIDVLERSAALFGCSVDYFTNETYDDEPLSVALRANVVAPKDMEMLAAINKIALNLRFMDTLLEEKGQ
ncbi:MAG: helix-turn-helix transcriptional regulator [Sphaerochaetaceae bacterium]